ncbi:MAG: hypothetical protein HZB68_02170 [Candidatus Aenigmarchaeota archaeon]|nr:hypothetical protein [Candidatus Aenigmarchaeota archaeon]
MIITFFDFNSSKCPTCLAHSNTGEVDYVNCKCCGTVFNKFSVLFPADMEVIDEPLVNDQEMN